MNDAEMLGELPEWDLGDLYDAPGSPALAEDLARAAADAKDLNAQYAGRIATLDGAALGETIALAERAHLVGKAAIRVQHQGPRFRPGNDAIVVGRQRRVPVPDLHHLKPHPLAL